MYRKDEEIASSDLRKFMGMAIITFRQFAITCYETASFPVSASRLEITLLFPLLATTISGPSLRIVLRARRLTSKVPSPRSNISPGNWH